MSPLAPPIHANACNNKQHVGWQLPRSRSHTTALLPQTDR